MNQLSELLLDGIFEQNSNVIALYGGGFKPPTKGHFEVITKTLQDYPEIDKLYVVIGSGIRNNISQDESYSIWNIYKKYLPNKVELVKSSSPLQYIKDYIKSNKKDKIYVVIGTREDNEGDEKDFIQRKQFFEKYSDNVNILNIITAGGISGTKARKAATQSKEELLKFIPPQLSEKEKDIIWSYIQSTIKENITIDDSPKLEDNFDYITHIKLLTKFMIKDGWNIQPLPKIKFIHDDVENSNDFFGKTAYYSPQELLIVLYTCNRHPKDVMRSFSHEMVHHMQNVENRLENIHTQNTNEDSNLQDIEKEAYLKGNITFRNWTDTLTEGLLMENHSDISQHIPPLTEGRYDKLTNQITSDIFFKWKSDYSQNSNIISSKYSKQYISKDIEVEVTAELIFTEDGGFDVDGGIYETENELEISFSINKEWLPEYWKEISFELKDVVRHEIEHATHGDNINVKPGKYIEDDHLERRLINKGLLSKKRYFLLPKEIDANLQGLYFKAKKQKLPFSKAINDYLDKVNLPPKDKQEVIDAWRTRAKVLSLPMFENIIKKPKYIIFCDMDGVLVDFDKGYEELTGFHTKHSEVQTQESFWKSFNNSLQEKNISEYEYWVNLDWEKGGPMVWDYIKGYSPYILTAPSRNPESRDAKKDWVTRLEGMKNIYFRKSSQKSDFSGKNRILIDDRKDNISDWIKKGGIGILHDPKNPTETINTLKKLGL